MDPVSLFLLTVAAIFIIGIVGEILFERTGVPDVIWLILVGIVLGPVTGLADRATLASIAPYFGAITLVVVLFDGGCELKLSELSQAAPRSSLLAILSFTLAVALVVPVVWTFSAMGILPESWGLLEALIVGAILGGSSSVVIMPALRKAGLAPRIANLVNLESALTDVLCVVATAACVKIAVQGVSSPGDVAATLGRSFGIGLAVGAVSGVALILVLRPLRKSQYAYPIILGTLLILYVVINQLGGSAALGIITVAVIVGNAALLSKTIGLAKSARLGRGVENAHDQIAFMIKSFFFTFIGAMLTPPFSLIMVGVLLGLVLLVARVPAVYASTVGAGISSPAKRLVVVCLPRGMAAGVLAMFPAQAGLKDMQDLPVVVFAAVVTTIMVFAGGFPVLRKKLVELDPSALASVPPIPEGAQADASVTYGYASPVQTQVTPTSKVEDET